MPVYLELHGIDPDDLDDDASHSPAEDEATALANDVYRVATDHGLDVDGAVTVVNEREHKRLRDGVLLAEDADVDSQ